MLFFPTKKQWKNWSLASKLTAIGAYVGIIALILSIVFFFIPLIFKDTSSLKQDNNLPEETKTIIEELLNLSESIPKIFQDKSSDEDELFKVFNKELQTNPYNIQVLILRGQYYYTTALSYGGSGYREALLDFEKAIKINSKLADPHFGIGTVYYQLAVFDLVKRNLYTIYEKGGIRFNKQTNLLERKFPTFSLSPDERNLLVLKAALNEFQIGNNLKSLYSQTTEYTQVNFATRDIDNRIRSIRILLGFDPPIKQDETILNILSIFISKLKPKGIEEIFDIISP